MEIEAVREAAKRELDMCKYRIEEMQVRYDEVISWTELYDAADLAAKKMIVANLINRIEVGTDYPKSILTSISTSNTSIYSLTAVLTGKRKRLERKFQAVQWWR